MLVFRARSGQDRALMPLTDAQRSLIDFERAVVATPGEQDVGDPGPVRVLLEQLLPRAATRSSICPTRRRTTRSQCGACAGGGSRAGASASRVGGPTPGAGEARRAAPSGQNDPMSRQQGGNGSGDVAAGRGVRGVPRRGADRRRGGHRDRAAPDRRPQRQRPVGVREPHRRLPRPPRRRRRRPRPAQNGVTTTTAAAAASERRAA